MRGAEAKGRAIELEVACFDKRGQPLLLRTLFKLRIDILFVIKSNVVLTHIVDRLGTKRIASKHFE